MQQQSNVTNGQKQNSILVLLLNWIIILGVYLLIRIKNSIFRNSLIFQGLPPIKYQNLMYFPLFLPL